MEETEVIIVGAGPTGQTLALTLARQGVRAKIVDQLSERSDKSRALIVQSRTLETFRTFGVVDEILARGSHGYRLRPHVQGRPFALIDIANDKVEDTRYPFTFFLSQVDTEEVLDRALAAAKIEIERPVTATSFERVDGGVIVTLSGPAPGQERRVKAKYVVGCDGAHSVVRKAAGLSFRGASYAQSFLLADVHSDDLRDDELTFFLGWGGIVGAIPLGKPGRFRLVVAGSYGDVSEEPTFEELQAVVHRVGNRPIAMSDPTWIARFRLHHRGVDRYRSGPFFVAGDAAHIHSPAGGQGMNTGIQDAYNLGWKLAMVVRGEADDKLLDSYHDERHAIGQQLLRTTDRMFNVMTSGSLFFTLVRLFVLPRVLPKILSSPVRREKQFRMASQLGMSYPKSPVVHEEVPKDATEAFRAAPGAGSRVPDGPTTRSADGPWLHDLLRAPKHHLVLVPRGLSGEQRSSAIADAEGACRMHGSLVEPIVVEDGKVADQLAGDAAATYLVRPDGVIAYRAPGIVPSQALGHLDAALGRARPLLSA